MNELPIYVPNSRVCRADQYHCCKQRQQCPLYPVCSQIQQPTVCQRNCPRCTYQGCSLNAEQRKDSPVYIDGIIQGERLDIDLDSRYWREQAAHRKRHRKLYYFYNCLWGDLLERNRVACRQRYQADPEYYRMLSRDSYRRRHKQGGNLQTTNEQILPQCGLHCDTCVLPDCTLPDNWREKALSRIRNQRYRKNNKELIAARTRLRRQRPDVKAQRAEYDKKYRQSHPDVPKKAQRKYRKSHPEKILEINRAYYQKNKDTINAKRRAKKAAPKKQNKSTFPKLEERHE